MHMKRLVVSRIYCHLNTTVDRCYEFECNRHTTLNHHIDGYVAHVCPLWIYIELEFPEWLITSFAG